MSKAVEDDVEQHVLDLLRGLGFECKHGRDFRPDSPGRERISLRETILADRLRSAVTRMNPHLPADAVDQAVRMITDTGFPEAIRENQRIHDLLVKSAQIQFRHDGQIKSDFARFVDWENRQNDWLAVSQFEVDGSDSRRPDVVLFLNGMPLVVIELKAPEDVAATLRNAFNQINTYARNIPSLFRTNLINVISDGLTARYGTISADFSRYMRWRTVDGIHKVKDTEDLAIETLVNGLLPQDRILQILRFFTVFEHDGKNTIKKVAGYHQFFAAKKGLESIHRAATSDGNGRGGVFWHTQGSGKSLLMAFLGGMIVHDPAMRNPTLVVITDRNDLDDQLFQTFQRCSSLFGQDPDPIENMRQLRTKLDVKQGGVFFSTIQKFQPMDGEVEFPLLSDRTNIVVFVDEAHRTQYGLDAKIDSGTGELRYGFAHYLRKGLPNAVYVGFTGTPIELGDRDTTVVFGNYIDTYDIAAAVEDEATVPIYYEARVARIELPEAEAEKLKEEYDSITKDVPEADEAKLGQKWSRMEALIGADERLSKIAADLAEHAGKRFEALGGKVMLVCSSRRICVEMYRKLAELRPEWHSDDDADGAMKVVMTGTAADPIEFQQHLRNPQKLEQLATRFRNAADPFKIVIVRNMWLTGFDAPSLHTIYIDKRMKGHDLMQTIARVNRVYGTKESGLIVDYIGIGADLKSALRHYSPGDQRQVGVDRVKALMEFEKRLSIMRGVFKGFPVQKALEAKPMDRLRQVRAAVEYVYTLDQTNESTPFVSAQDDGSTEAHSRQRARTRFMDASLALIKAYQLAAGSDPAEETKEEVSFYLAVRTAILKLDSNEETSRTSYDLDKAVQQLVNRAVGSTGVLDIMEIAGVDRPDVSILSDRFLEEFRTMKHTNVAVEALKKLLNNQIKSRVHLNITKEREFSDRLREAITKYHNRSVTSLEVIQELISLAKAIRDRPQTGLTPEEEAFYDALADNVKAVEVMGHDKLRLIAAELVVEIQRNSTADWWKWNNARSKIRVAVKRLLKKYGYPPEFEPGTVDQVVEQAERIAEEIAKGATVPA